MSQTVIGRGANTFADIIINSEVLFDDFEITQNTQGTPSSLDDTFEINTNGVNLFSLDQSGNLTIVGALTLDTGDSGKGKIAMDEDGAGNIEWNPPNDFSTKLFLTGHTKTEVEAGIGTLTDETSVLESLLQNTASELVNMGYDADSPIVVSVESEKGYIHLNDKLGVPDKVSLEFKSPIVIGNDFSLRLSGTSVKEPSTASAAPLIDAVYASGAITITFDDNGHDVSTWISGDLVNIRDETADASIDRIIQTISLVSGDQYTMTLTEAINFTTDTTDKVRRFVQQTPDTAIVRGDSLVTFTSTTGFSEGDFIQILDNRVAGDYTGNANLESGGEKFWFSNNSVRWESARIVKITTSTDMYLDRPLSHDYDNLATCYVIKISPRQHQYISNLLAIQIEAPDQVLGLNVRNNTHIIQLEGCLDCQVKNCSFTDNYDNLSLTQFPTIENFIRVRESYNCQVINCNIDRSNYEYSSSGGSYGITMYYSTNCSIQGGMLSTLRHNILFQGATGCRIDNVHIVNPLISGIDLHGLGSRDCIISNCYIDVAGNPSLDTDNATVGNTTIGALRVGNSFHPFGDDYNTFDNINVRIGNIADTNLTEVYGFEIEAPSSFNTFKNCSVVGTSQTGTEIVYGVYLADYDRERLLVTMTDNKFIDCYFENCEDGAVRLDGQASFQSSTYSYHTGTMTANENDSTHIVLPATLVNIPAKDPSDYDDYYGGGNITFQFGTVARNWDITFTSGGESGNTYEITDYVATTRVATLGTSLAVGTITGLTFELEDDSLIESNLPIINTKFVNCKFVDNNKLVFSEYTNNTTFIGNTFDTNAVKDATDLYVFDLDGDTNMNIIDNSSFNVHRWITITDQTTPKIIGNKHQDPQTTLTLTTLGTNTNIEYNGNKFMGYTPSYSISGTDTYVASRERIGYDSEPTSLALVVNNDNGRVGIGTDTPAQPLAISSGASSGGIILFNDTDTNGYTLDFSTGGTIRMDTVGGGKYEWKQSGSNVMEINTSGKVGIGTTAGTSHVTIDGGTSDGIRIIDTVGGLVSGSSHHLRNTGFTRITNHEDVGIELYVGTTEIFTATNTSITFNDADIEIRTSIVDELIGGSTDFFTNNTASYTIWPTFF